VAGDRFSFGIWTVGWQGVDVFGGAVRAPMAADRAVRKLAELGAYGVNFHDNDVFGFDAPAGERDRLVAAFTGALAETGLVVTTATTNLFAHPVFKEGAFTANDRQVRRFAVAKVMRNVDLAAELGSDVPFFLLGGAAAAVGRGTELYPLPDSQARPGLLIAPALHVSTALAYRALTPRLTTESQQNKIVSFQSQAWGEVGQGTCAGGVNDFETVVFEQFPQLAALKRRLVKLGANPAMMTGSGSALFGLFGTREHADRAAKSFPDERVFPVSLVSRRRYRGLWRRTLRPHIEDELWPPLSRYGR